ncbi:hypothetical protein GCM10009716_42500 [Streptomyces sodiiphilus]|uniref:ABC transporter permease n=1 Tax=Streptomyces sodiiphilus TaxID=226217 RepID=A0ABN2PS04_9ACTN
MLKLALQTLRFRKGSFLAPFLVLFAGVTILVACGGLFETGIRAATPPERFSAPPVVVTGEGFARPSLELSLAREIRSLPGVEQALPDVSFTAIAQGDVLEPGTALAGRGWSSALFSADALATGAAPRGPGEAVLDARLAEQLGTSAGDTLRLTATGSGRHTQAVRVTGLLDGTAPGADGTLYLTDREAARLADSPESADAIAVFAAAGTSTEELARTLEAALRDRPAKVLTGDARGSAEFPGASDSTTELVSMSAVFGGIAVMVTMFIVGSTLGLVVQQRLREMALLRAVGALPGQLRRMVMGETLLLSLGAIGLGLLPGMYAGLLMFDQLTRGGIVPPEIAYRAGWLPMSVAAGVSLATSLVAAYVASRRAAVTSPREALGEASLQDRWRSRPRVVLGLLCFVGATALALVTVAAMTGPVASSTAGPSAMLWACGVALLAPGLTRPVTALLARPLRTVGGVAGCLASDNARLRHVRTAAAATPVMLATGLATALVYLETSLARVGGGEGVGAWVNYLLSGTVISYAMISLVNTLLVTATERRREFALQRLVGATTGQIMRMMAMEAVLIAAVGIVLGSFVAAATLVPFGIALDGNWLPHGPMSVYLVITGFIGAVTLAASLLATRYALRTRPAEAVAVH